jgi:hypothetical protein
MKVGGNESATKFFQSNGGTAALASKDPKTKYTSNAATKYKDELKRRATKDAQEYATRPPLPGFSDKNIDIPRKLLSLRLDLQVPLMVARHQRASQPMTSSPHGTSLQSSALVILLLERALLLWFRGQPLPSSLPILMEILPPDRNLPHHLPHLKLRTTHLLPLPFAQQALLP